MPAPTSEVGLIWGALIIRMGFWGGGGIKVEIPQGNTH